MANIIAWENDMLKARDKSRARNLPILLFFHNPG
jgi:hypothetical protein